MEEWLASPVKAPPQGTLFLTHSLALMHSAKEKNGHTGSKYCFVCISIYSFSFSICAPLTPLDLLCRRSDYTSSTTNRKLLLSVRDYKCTLKGRNPQVEWEHHVCHAAFNEHPAAVMVKIRLNGIINIWLNFKIKGLASLHWISLSHQYVKKRAST